MKPMGFIRPYIEETEYIFGAAKLPSEVLMPGGQWDEWLPEFEPQMKNIETSNCTGFATLNAIEGILRKKYGVTTNYSDRALGISAGTYPPGNSPHTVADVVRKQGLLDENYLPFSELLSVDDYYSPKPLPAHLLRKMREWLAVYDFSHEWVFTPFFTPEEKRENLKKCLEFSLIGISVFGWYESNGKYVKPEGEMDNHWTLLYGYVDGDHWKVYDTYENKHKKLDYYYDFEFAKRYYVNRKTLVSTKPTIWDWFRSLCK